MAKRTPFDLMRANRAKPATAEARRAHLLEQIDAIEHEIAQEWRAARVLRVRQKPPKPLPRRWWHLFFKPAA